MTVGMDTSRAQAVASDGVSSSLRRTARGNSLILNFVCRERGFAAVRIPLFRQQPHNFVFSFDVLGCVPSGTLEVKLIDTAGQNVWWVRRPDFDFSHGVKHVVNKRRHFSYAWGPDKNPLDVIGYIELVVSTQSGTSGEIKFSRFVFKQTPVPSSTQVTTVHATSGRRSANLVLLPADRQDGANWHSRPGAAGKREYLRFDFEEGPRELSALVIDWGKDYASAYDIQARNSRGRWRTVDTVRGASGGRQFHFLQELEATSLRIAMDNGLGDSAPATARGYEIRSVAFKPYDFAGSYTDFLMHVAKDAPRGNFPRHMLAEQSYWTVVGVNGGANKALINEEGMVELDVGSPSLEPFVFDDQSGKLLTWADGQHEQSLADGYLPIPTVERRHALLSLSITAFAQGEPDRSTLYVTYAVENRSAEQRTGRLIVTLRPFQVNPEWQFLNTRGGFGPLRSIKPDTAGVKINDRMVVVGLDKPEQFRAGSCRHGDLVPLLRSGRLPSSTAIEDTEGTAYGAFEYAFDLAPNEKRTVTLAVLYNGSGCWDERANSALESVKSYWRRRLETCAIELPGAPELVNAMRSQLAYLLINRHQQAFQPGTRSYRRSWIRDGALTSSALLQHGHFQEVRDFIDWYTRYIREDGNVPCVVDQQGADWFPEHDSHGEYLYLVAEYYRYTGDKELLSELFPTMQRICRYIDLLRQQCRTPEYTSAEKDHLFGLLPKSASHEGYLSNPAYSYWDDMFAWKGLHDAAFVAAELGLTQHAEELSALAAEFKSDVLRSVNLVMWRRQLDYVPGAADLGDFDATSTTVGLEPTGLLEANIPAARRTFRRYWQAFRDRKEGRINWSEYTPYEWRCVGALLRLGFAQEALAATEWFMQDRRPRGWNHWAEVVHRDPLAPKFIGDMPHGWVGSDFLRSARALFAYETEDALVVAAGLKREWLADGVSAHNLVTRFGTLNLHIMQMNGKLRYEISGKLSKPVSLVVLPNTRQAWVNGKLQVPDRQAVSLQPSSLPAIVEIPA